MANQGFPKYPQLTFNYHLQLTSKKQGTKSFQLFCNHYKYRVPFY